MVVHGEPVAEKSICIDKASTKGYNYHKRNKGNSLKPIRWNEEKNQLLILQRGLSFEMVVEKVENEKTSIRL